PPPAPIATGCRRGNSGRGDKELQTTEAPRPQRFSSRRTRKTTESSSADEAPLPHPQQLLVVERRSSARATFSVDFRVLRGEPSVPHWWAVMPWQLTERTFVLLWRMRKGDATRHLILDHAAGLASQVGLTGLTIGALADDLQLSKSGLFAHFH